MTFFYDLNKRLANLAKQQDAKQLSEDVKAVAPKSRLAESMAMAERATGDYSAKKGAAGKDLGKPGKNFEKIAKSSGGGEKGKRIAGAVLNKLRAKESVSEGSMKQAMHMDAERMSLERFVAKYGDEDWVREFYNNTVGPMEETASKALTLVRKNLAPYAEEIADILDKGRMTVADEAFLDDENDIEQYQNVLLKMSNLFRRNPIKGLEYLGTLWSEIQEMAIGEVRDQLKIDLGQMYNQAFPKANRSFEESALQAYLGKKKYGDSGMKALQKAGRDGASKDKMARIRAQHDKMDEAEMEEGNEFSGELVRARAQGAKEFKVDGKSYPVKEEGGMPMTPKQKSFAKLAPPADKITFADKIAGAKQEVDEMLGDVAAEAMKHAIASRGNRDTEVDEGFADMDAWLKSREKEKGTGKFDKRERTLPTGMKATTYTRRHEDDKEDDSDAPVAKGGSPKKKGRPMGKPKGPERVTAKSYKYQGGRPAKTDEDLDTDGVMMTRPSNMSSESVDQKDHKSAVKAAMALLKKAGYKVSKTDESTDTKDTHAEKAGKKVTKDIEYDEGHKGKDDAKAERAGKKVAKDIEYDEKKDDKEEKVKEGTKGGYSFGGGVYESLDRQFHKALTEGMNVTVNMGAGEQGEPRKSITITADGDDADQLAELLKMAGLSGQGASCNTCNTAPCGCGTQVDENSPDWPTNTQQSDDALQYSGGLNKPKSTGQTTVPVIANQGRQTSMEENVQLERSLFQLYKDISNR